MKREIIAWGKPIELDVDYDVYEDETLLPEQVEALNSFINQNNLISTSTSSILKYIADNYQLEELTEDIILEKVCPRIIYVKRTPNKRTIAIMCDTDVDIEHGIALLFENEQFISIIDQDEIL